MVGSIKTLLLMSLISACLWYLTFSKKARQGMYRSAPVQRWMNRSQKGFYDSAYLAIILLFNLALTALIIIGVVGVLSGD